MHAVRRTIYFYLVVMTLVAMLAIATGFMVLYRLSLRQEKDHLHSVAMTYGNILESMADKGADEKQMVALVNDMPLAATSSRQTQEMVLARKEKEGMVFLYRQSEPTPTDRSSLGWGDAHLGQPMQRALNGQEGVFTGVDYSGMTVIAAHMPIAKGRWGLVVKIDLDEFRKPFLWSGALAFFLTLLLLSAGAWGINWLSHSWIIRLFDAEARYRALFNGNPDPIFLYGYFETGWPTKILEANQGVCRSLGYTHDELLRLGPDDILSGIADEQKEKIRGELVEKGFIQYKAECVTKDGKKFPVVVHSRMIQLSDQSHVICIVHDETCWTGQ